MNSDSESHSLSVPPSVRSETKEKFDLLLKNALRKTKERLLSEQGSTTASSENLLDRDDPDENFILNKFLIENKVETAKRPVPKPRRRTKVASSVSSHATFDVASPKLVKRKASVEENSAISNRTYTKELEEEQVGDIILHDSPKTGKVIVSTSAPDVKRANNDSDVETEKSSVKSNGSDNVQTFRSSGDSPKPHKSNKKSAKNKDVRSESIKSSIEKQPKNCEIESLHEENDKVEISENQNLTYENITELIIHKTDKLLIKSFLIHPVVNVHIIDMKTGKYYQKSNKGRSVVFYYENQETDYILPVMTHCYNLQERRTLYPSWEEKIVINEDFDYLAQENVMYFFEILDFCTITEDKQQSFKDSFKGWYRICFAFLKPIGKNGANNLNQKLRLQLYHVSNSKRNPTNGEFYLWHHWKTKKLKKYPASLYVTIKSLLAPNKVIEAMRSKTPLQREKSMRNLNEPISNNTPEEYNELSLPTDIGKISELKSAWIKASGTFQLPNKLLTRFETHEDGCFVHKFSNNGKYLAAAVKAEEMYSVVVYSMEDLKPKRRYVCHQALIYCITWSCNDSFIVTCSADNTIVIWEFFKNNFLQILPHPSFIYTSCINNSNVIASGCFDGFIRLWRKTDGKYDLHQELTGHEGFITSLCFNRDGKLLYSTSSTGQIHIWEDLDNEWQLKERLSIFELKNNPINKVMLFPNEKKLLVHSRDSTLRIVSLRNRCILHWLHGALNERVQINSCVSHCGNYVISGSENGLVTIWDAKTGNCLKTYNPYEELNRGNVAVHCVDANPARNILSMSSQTPGAELLIYTFESNPEVSLQLEPKPRSKLSVLKNDLEQKVDFQSILKRMDEIIH